MADSLSDAVLATLSEKVAEQENPGMVSAFVMVSEVVRADGTVTMAVSYPDGQSSARTIGLLDYGDEWVRDDIQRSFLSFD